MSNQERTTMRLLDDESRKTTFKEVALGYNHEEALQEASRCLNCKNPNCVTGCPVGVNIPQFISLLKEDKIDEAYLEIIKNNGFPGICGRVCPQERQCEGKCIRGIKGESVAIGRLERFTFDNKTIENCVINNKKLNINVGVVGSGPAGLAFASTALDNGIDVTIYEALHEVGGVLRYGIPEFRLPKDILDKEIKGLINKGCKIITNCVIGKSITLEELKDMHDYIFIATGAGLPRFMNIPGENLNGVLSSNEYLTRVNLMKGYKKLDTPVKYAKKCIVVGGGNVAMDAARCAKRMGSDVTIVYRRDLDSMPARLEEIHHAMEEGIIFNTLTNPFEIIGDELGNVKKIKCNKMKLGEPDESGRRGFKVIEGEVLEFDCDMVIMALGNFPNPILSNSTNLIKFTDRGLIEVDERNLTSCDKIYAGGDIATGAATVIKAFGAGKNALLDILRKINSKK